MTTRADRERWRQVLAATPADTALVTIRAGKLRGLLDALDAAETCHADCEERMQTAEARAMAAEGDHAITILDLKATVERAERAEARGVEFEGQIAELRAELRRTRIHPNHDGPCATGLLHPADITSPSRGVPNLHAAGAALQAVCQSCAGTKVLMGTCGPSPCPSCRGTGLA